MLIKKIIKVLSKKTFFFLFALFPSFSDVPFFRVRIFSVPIFPVPFFSVLFFPVPFFPLPFVPVPFFPVPFFLVPFFPVPFFRAPLQVSRYHNFCKKNCDLDLKRQKRRFYANINMLLKKFVKCSPDVKCYLFETYCCNLYCAPFWYDSTKTT